MWKRKKCEENCGNAREVFPTASFFGKKGERICKNEDGVKNGFTENVEKMRIFQQRKNMGVSKDFEVFHFSFHNLWKR